MVQGTRSAAAQVHLGLGMVNLPVLSKCSNRADACRGVDVGTEGSGTSWVRRKMRAMLNFCGCSCLSFCPDFSDVPEHPEGPKEAASRTNTSPLHWQSVNAELPNSP